MRGPRLFNALSDEERLARLKKDNERKIREVHRVRKIRLITIFSIIFLLLGIRLVMMYSSTQHINNQVKITKQQAKQQNKDNKILANKRDDLKDPDYVAKVIRYKFYYSKKGESIYNVPEDDKSK